MLGKRVIVGTLLTIGLILALWLDAVIDTLPLPGVLAELFGRETFPPGSVILVISGIVGFVAATELTAMLVRKGIHSSRRANCTAALVGLAVSTFVPEHTGAVQAVAVVATAAAGVLFLSIVFYSRHETVEGNMAATAGTLFSFVYLGLMFGFLMAIRREHAVWTVLWVLLVTKSCDIGAYFTGKAIGRHKLIPWLSPGKTIEGLAGGIVLASLVGAGGAALLRGAGVEGALGPVTGAIAGVIFAVVGQAGDLLASMLKRDAGVKDSGHTLPGMGGLIDILDSPLLVFPAAYWLLAIAG